MKAKRIALLALAAMLALAPLSACGRTDTPNAAKPPEAEETPPLSQNNETPPAPEVSETLPPPEEKAKTTEYLLVTTNGLNIRSGAGTSYGTVGQVQNGALLTYTGRTENGWHETRYKNGVAYVSANYTQIYTIEAQSDETETVIARAFELLGTPYVYGAVRYHDGKGNKLKDFTVTKFDCSSYMQYVFYEGAGVLLNMNTRTQVTQGTPVDKDDVRRGDLFFFTNADRKDNVGIERVGHVGLYLGDGYMIHTASDYARAEKMSTARWNYYICARRFL